ncbi:MAG: hypothetical protein AAFP19_26790, partial [Bacteroidota bacterium]
MKKMKLRMLFSLVGLLLGWSAFGQADHMVDLFTGDFQYQIPAMTIPSTEGPAVALALSYRGGVQMNQRASWVGLGWDLSIGEIKRVVKGVPDEWNGVEQVTRKYKKVGTNWVIDTYTVGNPPQGPFDQVEETTYWGPMYFKDFVEGPNNAMDTYFADPRVGKDVVFPDYDQFVVSGPGISGTMQAFLFDQGSLVHKDDPHGHFYIDAPGDQISMYYSTNSVGGISNPPQESNANNLNCLPFTHEAQFRFKDEFGDINLPAPLSRTTKEVGLHKSLDGFGNLYNGQFDQSSKKAIGAKHVVYFTNADIRNNLSDLVNNKGFIDYPKLAVNSRGHDEDIGAFKITNEAGMTFHYSLPAYIHEEHNLTFEMEDFDISQVDKITHTSKARAYVDSWKLTAITGTDFVDHAPKGVIGPEDEGYWVLYDYTLWESHFEWQTPYLDGNRFFGENREAYQQLAAQYGSYWFGAPEHLDYLDTENISYGTKEMYYVDR